MCTFSLVNNLLFLIFLLQSYGKKRQVPSFFLVLGWLYATVFLFCDKPQSPTGLVSQRKYFRSTIKTKN